MVWRNPATNRFEAGDGPADGIGQPSNLPPAQQAPAVPPRGGDIHRAWDDFLPTTENGMLSGGNPVESVADVLNAGNPLAADAGTDLLYGPKKEHDGGVS